MATPQHFRIARYFNEPGNFVIVFSDYYQLQCGMCISGATDIQRVVKLLAICHTRSDHRSIARPQGPTFIFVP